MKLGTNPFETGHIKNYILLYASIVVIMILFFFAGELFIEPKEIEKKVFDTEKKETKAAGKTQEKEEKFIPKFKLLEKAY